MTFSPVMSPAGSEELVQKITEVQKNLLSKGVGLEINPLKEALNPLIEYTRSIEWIALQLQKDIEIIQKGLNVAKSS